MNTNSKNKFIKRALLATIISFSSISSLYAISDNDKDEFGVWTTFEIAQKANKRTKLAFDAELRSIEGVSNVERVAIGAKVDYKLGEWKGESWGKFQLKINAGYTFIVSQSLSETSIKDAIDVENDIYEYNIDAAYWTTRNRVYATLTGEYKVGRFEISLRERLQYTHTGSATTDETKYRWEYTDVITGEGELLPETEREFKEAKHNLSLRSRLSIKYDIPNCKITPFASAELYTKLNEWKGYDKMRYRAGASYKINKKNSVSLYYLYQDISDIDEPGGHAIGLEYSIDL